ncbi:AcrR family transcriptional regulator [Thermocatellispora tengchongensis]|uniref:AcrR family transcriptional regulator n=1 Tax=Thermocatellispora tengchongensis TaxID=1073253 RepID=A0A840PV80_9ACTN|nr:TetR/AcrR family transcriptional regulator [Thermocatellispora tengchongensis]MBB5139795.1 AcrR family transcriptional regulator [Thermocatellispora tengchongensis]
MSTTNTGPGAQSRHVTAILDAATRRFAQTGYHGTSMRDIGAEMGMHAGSLYVHIRSKEDLLDAIVWDIAQSTERRMEAVLAAGDTPVDKLRTIAEEHLRWVAANPDAATVYFHEWRHLKGERLERVKAARARWTRGLRDIIQAGIDEGAFKPMDVRLAGLAFVGMLNSTYRWLRPDGDLDTAEIAGTFMDFLLHGWAAG